MISGTSKTFSLHVRCPYGDFEDWITVRGRLEPLEQLLGAPFAFECPLHGVQSEFPLEGTEKRSAAAVPASPGTPRPAAPKKRVRSSERKLFHVPVFVYGWSKSANSFHEDTTTLVFNSSGALVRLLTPMELGEDLFLVNKFTREEQRVRVVFLEPDHERGMRVGLAFQKPVPMFWRKTRRGPRAPQALRVVVRGKDRNGNPFAQSSSTVDISEDGARLEGIAYLTTPGDIIEVKRRWHGKARFRVAWIGRIGSLESNQVGVSTVGPGRLPWRVKADERRPARPAKKS
jgi:hypothetical protein